MMKNMSGLVIFKNLNNIEKRKKALEDYYKNPNYCKECEKRIELKKGARIGDIRVKKFCNQSCSAIYNNKRRPKKTPKKRIQKTVKCPQCNGTKIPQSKVCHDCKIQNSFKKCMKSKISDYISNGNARIKYNQIRHWARRHLEHIGREKKCIVCGYEKFPEVLEVCHIRDISDFPEDSLMSEVNGADNLEYMCPTHHKEFDKGFLDIDKYRMAL